MRVSVAAWLALVIVGLVTVWGNQPPKVLPARAARTLFSAERAERWVRALALGPHPNGSPRAGAVANRITLELRRLGLDVIEQRAPACTSLGPFRRCAPVRNVVGIWRGVRANGPAVLLSAHYDTVPNSPGAGDDTAAVAALLETARALSQGSRLEHDVLFAFVDGEEELLLGAAALARQPDFERVFLAINFEARGNRGPSVLIDTTPNNAALVRKVTAASRAPALNSLYVALAGVLPNGTDAELYKQHVPAVLSYAVADGLPFYHQGSDTPAHLDLRSVQHHGQHALDLARTFGNASPASVKADHDAVFFDLFGVFAVSYPYWAARALFGVLLGLGGLYWWRRRPRQWPSPRHWLVCGVVTTLAALGSLGLSALVVWVLTRGFATWAAYERSSELVACALLVTLALGVMLLGACARTQRLRGVGAAVRQGGQGTLWGLGGCTALAVPGASHLFLWSLAGGLLSMALSRSQRLLVRRLAPLALAPAVMFLTLLWRACTITFGAWAAVVVVPMVLTGLALIPGHPEPLAAEPRGAQLAARWWPAVALLACFAVHLHGRLVESPARGVSMFFISEPGAHRAHWASQDQPLTAWHRSFLGPQAERGRWPDLAHELPLWRADARFVSLSAPRLELVSDEWIGPERHIVLRVASTRGARALSVQELSGARFEGLRFDGAPVVSLTRVSPEVDTEFLRRFAGIDMQGRFSVDLSAIPPRARC